MTYGYCSAVNPAQNLEGQARNILKEFPEAAILKEKYTIKKKDRPEWDRMMEILKPGDTLVFDSVMRMGRSKEDALRCYELLMERGVTMVFLKERYIDASVYRRLASGLREAGKGSIAPEKLIGCVKSLAQEQIRLVFERSESELEKLRRKTAKGMEAAAKKGRISGRKAGVKVETKLAKKSKELILKYSKAFGGTLSDTELIKLCGCSKNSYYKYKSMLTETEKIRG